MKNLLVFSLKLIKSKNIKYKLIELRSKGCNIMNISFPSFFTLNDDKLLEKVVLVDLDGTLIDVNTAIKHAMKDVLGKEVSLNQLTQIPREKKAKIWDIAVQKYWNFMYPNKDVHDLIKIFKSVGFKIIITSGRFEYMRSVTEKTLKKLGIQYDELLLRPSPNMKDEEWKAHIVRNFEKTSKIVIFIDDKWENVEFIRKKSEQVWIIHIPSRR